MIEPRFSDPAEEQDPATENDRRGGDRFGTVWRIAKVTRDGDAGLWRVRNMSDGGMMLAVDVPVTVGERLEIALSDTIVIHGRVAWCPKRGAAASPSIRRSTAPRCCAASPPSSTQSGGYRAPRLPVHTRAQLVTDDGTSDMGNRRTVAERRRVHPRRAFRGRQAT